MCRRGGSFGGTVDAGTSPEKQLGGGSAAAQALSVMPRTGASKLQIALMAGLTPELSRPAKRVRLERIVRWCKPGTLKPLTHLSGASPLGREEYQLPRRFLLSVRAVPGCELPRRTERLKQRRSVGAGSGGRGCALLLMLLPCERTRRCRKAMQAKQLEPCTHDLSLHRLTPELSRLA